MKHIKIIMSLLLLALGAQANATIMIDPATTTIFDSGSQTSTSIIVDYITSTYGVTEAYKKNVDGGGESGTFADSYDVAFSNSLTDPEDALLSYTGGSTISCPTCYLLVKDGNQDPAWYLFNISGWDGMESIDMQNFWPTQGAISHVSIFNSSSSVPSPGSLAIMAIGLMTTLVVGRAKKIIS